LKTSKYLFHLDSEVMTPAIVEKGQRQTVGGKIR